MYIQKNFKNYFFKRFLERKKYKNKCFRVKKFGTLISSAKEFERQLRAKRSSKYNLYEKLEKHFKELGFEKEEINELLKNMDESKWPRCICNEESRIRNRNIIENYSK